MKASASPWTPAPGAPRRRRQPKGKSRPRRRKSRRPHRPPVRRWPPGIEPMILHRSRHTLRLGLRSLVAHRLRSSLTVLGIVLGVGSVIVMLAVGEAARYEAVKQLQDLGATTGIVRSVKPAEQHARHRNDDLIPHGLTTPEPARINQTSPPARP